MLERATRLCAMSPMMATRRPSSDGAVVQNGARVEQRLGGMLVRAVARVDDGRWAGGAPGSAARRRPRGASRWRPAAWPPACSACPPAIRPWRRWSPTAVIEMASAPRRLAAISKLVRVRVEASKNRFTIILPRSDVQPLERLVLHGLEVLGARQNRLRSRRGPAPRFPAVLRAWSTPSATTFSTSSTFSIPSISWNFTSMISLSRGLHHAADVAGLDGQLAVAAVDEHQQLHARRAAVVEQRVQRGAHGAAGVEHVVHEDDVLARARRRESRWR